MGEKIEKGEPKIICGIKPACKRWGLGRKTLFELIKQGLPCKIILRRYYFPVKKVDDFLEKI